MAESITIKGAYSYYTQVKFPGALKWEEKADPENPVGNREYVMEVLVKAKELSKIKKKYKKAIKLLRETSQYTEKQFTKRFKISPPEGKEFQSKDDDGDIVYETIKLRKHASWPSGDATDLVDVFGCMNKRTVDRNGLKITQQVLDKEDKKVTGKATLIGNGSLVTIQCTVRALKGVKGNQSQFDLYKIQVLDLIEWSDEPEDDFADEGDDEDFNEDDFSDEDESVEDEPEDEPEDNDLDEDEDDDFD